MSGDIPLNSGLCVNVRAELSRQFHVAVKTRIPTDGITVIFGPSGAGKSTVLRLIAGFAKADSGHIRFDGQDWYRDRPYVNRPAHRRGVGFMFQSSQLFPHLSVAQNLDFAEKRARPTTGAGPAHPAFPDRSQVIDIFELSPILDRKIDGLSGGERKRIALARTLLSRPQLLLLDEPLSALDRSRKRTILAMLKSIPQQFKIPLVYVTHDVEELTALADHIILMSAGTIAAAGPLAEVLPQIDLAPLGDDGTSSVLHTGRITAIDEQSHLMTVGSGPMVLELPISRSYRVGDMIALQIRARDVSIARNKPEQISIRNCVKATISAIMPVKGTGYVILELAVGEIKLKSRITKASVSDLSIKPGQDVFALIKSVSFDRIL